MDVIVEQLTPQAILGFKAAEAEIECAQQLMERNNDGTLTHDQAAALSELEPLLLGKLRR